MTTISIGTPSWRVFTPSKVLHGMTCAYKSRALRNSRFLDGAPESTDTSFALQTSNDISSPLPDVDDTKDTAYTAWEAERKKVLAERQAKADQDKQIILAKAKEDIEKSYAQREDKIAKTKSQNREDEKNFRTDMESLMKYGNQWEKVGKLVNLAPQKTESAGKHDRMRKLLSSLKNEKKNDE